MLPPYLVAQPPSDIIQRNLEGSFDFILVWEPVRDPVGSIVDLQLTSFNKELTNTSQTTPDQLPKNTLTELHNVSDDILAAYIRVIETGTPYKTERSYEFQGHTYWYDITATKLNDSLLTIVKDITATKKVALELQAQSQLLNQIFDSSLNGIYVLQSIRDEAGNIIDFRVTQCNQVARKEMMEQLGLDPLNRTLSQVYPTTKELGVFKPYVEVVETGRPLHAERHYPQQDQWYAISAVKLDDGLVVTFVNISDTKRAAQQAIRQSERIEGLLNGSINGMLAMEPVRDANGLVQDFRFVMANEIAIQMSRISMEDLIGNSLNALFPSAKQFGLFDAYIQVLETGQLQRKQFFYNVDDYQEWYDMAIARMDSNTLVLSYVDITESKVMQQQLEKMVEELKRSNEYLEQFAYIASHDLQEPLRKIGSFSNLLIQNYASSLDETARDYLNRLSNSSMRMQAFVRNLLSYSRLTVGNEQMRHVSLNRILTEVLLDFDEIIREKYAQISFSALPVVQGNATQLQQLFQNLISNALKFSQTGKAPVVQINSRIIDSKDLKDTSFLQHKGQWLVIELTDNGIGFEEKHQERVFQLFQRLHGRNQYEGTGIGLALCKKVAELHGGTITARSTPGEGSTFTVFLPYQET